MSRRLLLPLVPLVLLAAGCGEEKSAGSGTAGGDPREPVSATGGDTVRVAMRDFVFSPEQVTARVGQTVRWTNEDDVKHNVTARKGADFRSRDLSKGGTYRRKMTKAGTIAYVCTIHPSQRGTISVVGS